MGKSAYQTDSDSALLLLGHRYYDPSIGRFLSSDPAQAGSNWYDYCSNNPLVWVDPSGKSFLGVALGLLAAAVVIIIGGGPEDPIGDGAGAAVGDEVAGEVDGTIEAGPADDGGADDSGDIGRRPSRGGWGDNLPTRAEEPEGPYKNTSSGDGDSGTVRTYDEDGRAKTDYDWGHDYEKTGDPHAHDWDWDNPGKKRMNARRLFPDEKLPNKEWQR